MTAAVRVDWFAQVKAWPVASVAERFGLEVHRRGMDVSFRCPACRKELRHQRTRADKRKAAKVMPGGAGWWCEPCGETGTAVDLAAWLTLGRVPMSGDEWAAVRRSCASLGLCEGESGPVGRLHFPPARPPEPLPAWPVRGEVMTLWSASTPLTTATTWSREAWSALETRGFNVHLLAKLDACRVLPERFEWPQWWPSGWSTTWRLVVPAWNEHGELVSLHARAIAAAQLKTRWPKGCSASGLLFADPLGVTFLREWDTPGALAGLEFVVIAEGMTDTLKLSVVAERDESTVAVLGYVAGSARALGRIAWPPSVPVLLAVDDDEVGDHYAAEVRAVLPSSVRVWRVKPPQGRGQDGKKRGDWSDLDDERAGQALLESGRWEALP
jgi:hypothetical protein